MEDYYSLGQLPSRQRDLLFYYLLVSPAEIPGFCIVWRTVHPAPTPLKRKRTSRHSRDPVNLARFRSRASPFSSLRPFADSGAIAQLKSPLEFIRSL
ncbi:hypothetical protein DTO212C5_8278 [Paecilomyces variotii]|nr:hypothetical protein DTO212C5_8278 [Paecilomyces variotii]